MDESSKQHIKEIRSPIEAQIGKVERYDTEYERNGVSNIFMFFEPLTGSRRVEITDQHTAVDWAKQIKTLVDDDYPNAERITLVMDNLNIHTGASLYKAFPPEEARRILNKLEFQYTPKHGSWLNMAEVRSDVAAWEKERNNMNSTINWRFTTDKARIKLLHLYPAFNV